VEVRELAAAIEARRARARHSGHLSIYDDVEAPSLWLGANPLAVASDNPSSSVAELVRFLHDHLDRITWKR
jgi:hypothetical protein